MKKCRFMKKESTMKWNRILGCLAIGSMFWGCSDTGSDDNGVAGGASGDAGIIAVTDWEVAGVSQKGPFVTGSAVTVQELDGITLKQTGKSFKGSIKSDKGDFAIKDINLESQYAILEASGYYRDEISGKKSSGQVTLRALTDLKDRKHVNINLLTHLEYERVMYLVTEKKKSIAEAKEQAEREVLATFGIEGDFAESEDLNIFETGDGNAALLAISVLLQSDVDVAGLTERMGEFSISLAEGGSWDDADAKTAIADWACDVDLKGSLSKVRKNVEDWKYADTVPAFEKYVTNFWWNNYGLGVCNDKRENETKRNVNKLSKMYNEYFVCEGDRWVIPGDEPKSSSSMDGSSSSKQDDVSSSSEKDAPESSSSVASSSSVYNPFDTVPELPADLAFLDSMYKRISYMSMGEGKQKVWFYSNKTNLSMPAAQDSAASEFVKFIGKKGFSFEGAVRNDSTRLYTYDDTSYVYVKEKDNLVYKLALTKWTPPMASEYGFSIKVVVLKDGFEELSTKTSVLPKELFFVDKFLLKPINPAEEYADGKQIVWRGGSNACGSGCDSFIEELVDDAKANGFVFSGTYSNDSLDNKFTEDSHVYSKTSGGKVYSVIFTKGDTTVCHPFAGVCSDSWMYSLKLIVRDEGIDEIPTETRADFNSPKYREIPEDLKFVIDSTQYYYRSYSDDPKWTTWAGSTLVNYDSTLFDEALAVAEEYADMVKLHGFSLKSEEALTMDELQKKLYNVTFGRRFGAETTVFTFEKDVENFRYEILVYAVMEDKINNLGYQWVECRAEIRATMYDK